MHLRDYRPPSNAEFARDKRGVSELIEDERVPERGRIRVAQGSPGKAGTGLLEQVLLVTFGETKVTKTIFSKDKIPDKQRKVRSYRLRVRAAARI